MLLFFPQWQGAGQGNRIDIPARALMAHLRAAHGLLEDAEIPVDTGETHAVEQGIWARGVLRTQLAAARDLLDQQAPETVFTIGGDCGIEAVLVPYLNSRHDDFALVWLDAHPDLNTPETSPSGTFHGMPLRVICGEGDADFVALASKPLTPEQVLLVGTRSVDSGEREFIDRHRIVNFADEVPDIARAITATLLARGVKNVYIHLDFDILDPQAWPYMNYPEPAGFSIETVSQMIESLAAAFRIVGMNMTEYASEDGGGLDTIAPILTAFTRLSQPRDE